MAYFTRSRAQSCAEHEAAGVLPFALHEGAVLVLLGAEPCKTGPGGKVWKTMWRDFGGGREAADVDSAATAAREFAEETLGLFGGCGVNAASVALAAAAMEPRLRDPRQALKVVHALKKGSYHFYMVQTPFLAPLMLHLATQQNSSTGSVAGAEKSAFAWVPLKALLECVAASAPRYVLQAAAHVCGGYGTPPPIEGGRHRFQLHPSFANSVRKAQRCGLQELLARAEELPLPPPPPLVLLPAAEQVEAAHGQAAAVAAAAAFQAAAVAAAAGVEGGCCSEEGEAAGLGLEPEDSGGYGYGTALGIEHSLGYLLARADIAAALRGDPPAAAAAAAAALSPSLQPAPIPHPAQQQQQQPQRCQQHAAPADNSQPQSPMRSGLAAAGRWGHTTVPSTTPAQSGSSVAHPSSSIDTASSLRESRQAAAAAAVGEVVQTIEENSRRPRQRPSRKQRQKLRRQRQKQEQAIAAAAALGSPDAAKRQQQKQQPSNPPWEQAGEEDEAQFQPHVRRCKRLRLQVSTS